MFKIRFTIWVLPVLILMIFFENLSAQADLTVIQRLNEAESIKSADVDKYSRLLQQLEVDSASFSPYELDYYNYLKGYELAITGEIEEALRHYQMVTNRSDSPDLLYRAHFSAANVHAATRNFEESLIHLERSLALLNQVQDSTVRNTGLAATSIIYNQLGQYDLAISYSQALIDGDAVGRNLCMAHAVITEARLFLTGLTEHINAAHEGIKICEQAGEPVHTNFLRSYVASDLLSNEQFQASLDMLLRYVTEVEGVGYPTLTAEFYSLIAESHFKLEHTLMAESFAQKALAFSSEQPYSKPIVRSLSILYLLSEQSGEMQTALDYHKRYAEADKAYLDEISAKNLAVQMAERDLQEKNSRIELLNKENQVLQLQQNLDREAAENTRLLLILLSAVIGFIALWALRTKRNQIRFKEMAQCDELTGAFNRRHFSELSNHHLQIAESNYSPVALVMFDLDHFKSINDRFGHPVGDWVLQETINVCKQFCRENDVFGRLGGEEFAVLLPGCNMRHAEQFADKCRRSIAAIDTSQTGHEFTVHASFGISEATADGFKLKDVISAADEALYVAKSRGRDQVICSDQLGDLPEPTADQVS